MTREALFHCQFGAVQPKRGDVLHKVAAYNSAGRVTASDGTLYDFSRKADEHVGGCIMLPDGAPAEYADPVALWAAAQDAETRIDGQPARLVEFTIPREVPADQRLEFTRAIVAPWVVEGAAAQIDIHCPPAADGGEQPHAHVILSRRALGPEGFAARKLANTPWTANKGRDMRGAVAERMNQWLADHGVNVRVDHRSHRERGDDTPTEGNVSRAAVETWKRRPDEATTYADTLAARPIRRQLRNARREQAAAKAEIVDLSREYNRRVPGCRAPRRRQQTAFDPAWLPPVGDGVSAVEPEKWGGTITLADGSAIVARADRLVIRGRVTDAAIAALADQAVRQGWTDGVELTGNKAFRDRLAAALAERGVRVTNHPEPPSVPGVSLDAGTTTRRLGGLNKSSDVDPPTSPTAEPTAPIPQENRHSLAPSTASADAEAPTRRHVEVNVPSSVETTGRRSDGDRRRALAALSESERQANDDYAAGRITTTQLQAARLPSAAVAGGDRATIEAAMHGDLDAARQAAERWQAERNRRAAAAARRAAADEPTPDHALAPALKPFWATGQRKTSDSKRG